MAKATAFKPPMKRSRPARAKTESVAGELRGRAEAFGEAQTVPLVTIADRPGNEQLRVEPEQVAALARSVEAVGVLVPVVVSSAEAYLAEHPGEQDSISDAEWVLVMGHRRCQAARAAGLTEVPVVVRNDLAGIQGDEVPLHENDAETRLALTPLQEARRYAAVMSERGLSQRKLAEHLNKKQAQISRRLSLLELPETAQHALERDQLTLRAAVEMASELKRLGGERSEVEAELAALVSEGVVGGYSVDGDVVMREAKSRVAQRSATVEASAIAEAEGLHVQSWTPSSAERVLRDPQRREEAVAKGEAAVTVSPAGQVEWIRTTESDADCPRDVVRAGLVRVIADGLHQSDASTVAQWAVLAGGSDAAEVWAWARETWTEAVLVGAEGDTRVSPGRDEDLEAWSAWAQEVASPDLVTVVAAAWLESHRRRRPADVVSARWSGWLADKGIELGRSAS